jgi:hypothetical protein
MKLYTVSNYVEKRKGFVYSNASFTENDELEVDFVLFVIPRRSVAVAERWDQPASTHPFGGFSSFHFGVLSYSLFTPCDESTASNVG